MKKRDYSYDTAYEARPEQVKNREARNNARRELERQGRVHKGDGRDVAHKRALKNGGSTSVSNVEVQSQKENRGWRRHRSGYSVPDV